MVRFVSNNLRIAAFGLFAGLLLQAGDARAETFRVLYNFQGSGSRPYSDGAYPEARLFFDLDFGKIYGTTMKGGSTDLGTVFEIGPFGDFYKVIYSFRGPGASDCAVPRAGLISLRGEFYGTCSSGGANNRGAVFKINPGGNERVVHSFRAYTGSNFDGADPEAPLVADAAGNLYGTTTHGGVKISGPGTVFKITASGQESMLLSFKGYADPLGGNPQAGLVFGKDGYLYGTTTTEGARFNGTVFKISTTGAAAPVSDLNWPIGSRSKGGLFVDAKGNLYGTTSAGGYGSVFEVAAADGGTRLIQAFQGTARGGDGAYPMAGVVGDAAGYLYGTTEKGGKHDLGTVFKLKPYVSYTVLYSFDGATGRYPRADLIIDPLGNLYGTTSEGGSANKGVIFKISK